MIIRDETPSDYAGIAEVTRSAFEDHPYSRQTEVFIIRDLRAADALAVSLVAQIDGKVAGHIAFSPITVTDGSRAWYGM